MRASSFFSGSAPARSTALESVVDALGRKRRDGAANERRGEQTGSRGQGEASDGSPVGYARGPGAVYIARHSANAPCSGGPPPHDPVTSTSPSSRRAPFH